MDTKFTFGQSQLSGLISRPIKKGSSASRVSRRVGLRWRDRKLPGIQKLRIF